MSIATILRQSPEEIREYEQREYDELWFEPGRTYRWEIDSHWVSGWGFYRLECWTVYIRQAECPWMLIASESFDYHRTLLGIPKAVQYKRAVRWAKQYVKRGGPPDNHWAKRMYEEKGYKRR